MNGMRDSLYEMKTIRVSNAVAAGQTTIDCDIVDLQGFDAYEYQVLFGTISAGGTPGIKLQQGELVGGGDLADISGSAKLVAETDDNKVLRSLVLDPRERYSRAQVTRAGGANSVVDGVLCHLYKARSIPITQSSTVAATERTVGPVEGTA